MCSSMQNKQTKKCDSVNLPTHKRTWRLDLKIGTEENLISTGIPPAMLVSVGQTKITSKMRVCAVGMVLPGF